MRHTPAPLLALGTALAAIYLPSSALAQYDDFPSTLEIEDSEYEALITALDALGLSLDDPELKNLDNGDLWAVIDDARRAGKGRGLDGQNDKSDH